MPFRPGNQKKKSTCHKSSVTNAKSEGILLLTVVNHSEKYHKVNIIKFLDPEPSTSTCKAAFEAYQTMYEASFDLANNWLKKFFVFNVVCHYFKDFCKECFRSILK